MGVPVIKLVPGDDWLGTQITLTANGVPVNLTAASVASAVIKFSFGSIEPNITITNAAAGVLTLTADRSITGSLPTGLLSELTITTRLAAKDTTWFWGLVEGVHSFVGSDATVAALGPQGPSGTLAVGVVVTGAAGSNAAVANSGTNTDAVLNFTIPRGDQGLAGSSTIEYGVEILRAAGIVDGGYRASRRAIGNGTFTKMWAEIDGPAGASAIVTLVDNNGGIISREVFQGTPLNLSGLAISVLETETIDFHIIAGAIRPVALGAQIWS